jgi:hypothetical protein
MFEPTSELRVRHEIADRVARASQRRLVARTRVVRKRRLGTEI